MDKPKPMYDAFSAEKTEGVNRPFNCGWMSSVEPDVAQLFTSASHILLFGCDHLSAPAVLEPDRLKFRVPCSCGSSDFRRRAPVELGSVSPDAVQDDCQLPRARDLGLLEADAPHKPLSPCLQRRDPLCAVDEHVCRLERIAAQQPIAPSRDTAGDVELPRLLAPGRQAEIGADTCC